MDCSFLTPQEAAIASKNLTLKYTPDSKKSGKMKMAMLQLEPQYADLNGSNHSMITVANFNDDMEKVVKELGITAETPEADAFARIKKHYEEMAFHSRFGVSKPQKEEDPNKQDTITEKRAVDFNIPDALLDYYQNIDSNIVEMLTRLEDHPFLSNIKAKADKKRAKDSKFQFEEFILEDVYDSSRLTIKREKKEKKPLENGGVAAASASTLAKKEFYPEVLKTKIKPIIQEIEDGLFEEFKKVVGSDTVTRLYFYNCVKHTKNMDKYANEKLYPEFMKKIKGFTNFYVFDGVEKCEDGTYGIILKKMSPFWRHISGYFEKKSFNAIPIVRVNGLMEITPSLKLNTTATHVIYFGESNGAVSKKKGLRVDSDDPITAATEASNQEVANQEMTEAQQQEYPA